MPYGQTTEATPCSLNPTAWHSQSHNQDTTPGPRQTHGADHPPHCPLKQHPSNSSLPCRGAHGATTINHNRQHHHKHSPHKRIGMIGISRPDNRTRQPPKQTQTPTLNHRMEKKSTTIRLTSQDSRIHRSARNCGGTCHVQRACGENT